MSIVYKDEVNNHVYHSGQITDTCFFCGKDIWEKDSEFVVMWMCMEGDIYLHPSCAEHLSTRLIRDVVEGKMQIKLGKK